ncbi:MAG: LemA family protein [Clostridia bacterium]|nr:LemA family protein [Clostridia bacterium]
MKNKKLITVLVIAGIVLLLVFWGVSTRNGFVTKEQSVQKAQSQISTYLQRRADLIPNFVNTVEGYTNYEQSTLTAVTEARAKAGSATTAKEQSQANAELDRAINVWVNAVTEAYPNIKADTHFTALQDELAGSENRIATARKDYNDAVEEYNVAIRKFPASIIASISGFDKADYFENTAESNSVPNVSFSK